MDHDISGVPAVIGNGPVVMGFELQLSLSRDRLTLALLRSKSVAPHEDSRLPPSHHLAIFRTQIECAAKLLLPSALRKACLQSGSGTRPSEAILLSSARPRKLPFSDAVRSE